MRLCESNHSLPRTGLLDASRAGVIGQAGPGEASGTFFATGVISGCPLTGVLRVDVRSPRCTTRAAEVELMGLKRVIVDDVRTDPGD